MGRESAPRRGLEEKWTATREKRRGSVEGVVTPAMLSPFLMMDEQAWSALPKSEREDVLDFLKNAVSETVGVFDGRMRARLAELAALSACRSGIASDLQALERGMQNPSTVQATAAQGGHNLLGRLDTLRTALNEIGVSDGLDAIDGFQQRLEHLGSDTEALMEAGEELEELLGELFDQAALTAPKDATGGIHDALHYVDRYLKAGAIEKPAFLLQEIPEDRFAPEVVLEELYPSLFEPSRVSNLPISVVLQDPALRAQEAEYHRTHKGPNEEIDRLTIAFFEEAPKPTPGARLKEFERWIALVEADLVARYIHHNPPKRILQKIFDAVENLDDTNRPEHYKRFAHRIFSLEYKTNPRLFYEEVLAGIRTIPKQSA